MDSAAVVGFSTIIPLSLSLGLILDHMPALRVFYLVFAGAGLVSVLLTRWAVKSTLVQTVVLTIVHGIAGLIIFLLPLYVALEGITGPAFSLVGIGGALIGVAGLLLSFLKIGKPILAYKTTLRIFPSLLFLMTTCFVAGFVWGS
jgi:hypothetical protein